MTIFYKIISVVAVIIGLFCLYKGFKHMSDNKKCGRVIIINGPSATGKTSLQK